MHGNAIDRLRELPDNSIHCTVTSPPYWGLRSYLPDGHQDKHMELGLEPTPEAYVANMVEVFREVRRVLRADGVCFLNLGDCYATGAGKVGDCPGGGEQGERWKGYRGTHSADNSGKAAYRLADGGFTQPNRMPIAGLKPKDLVGMPWRAAFALQADGWWLRSDIIWSKPSPMPESVRDRPTKAHEYIFMLAKGKWSRRAVKLSDLRDDRIHFSTDLVGSDANTWAAKLSIGIATAILNSSHVQEQLGGRSFNEQIRQERERASGGHPVADLPPMHRMARYAARVLNADASPKEFLAEVHRIGLVLGKRDSFLIRGCDAEIAYTPAINAYGKTSIAIHDAGKIGEFDLVHGQIIAHTPTTCTYFYDAEAVKEVGSGRAPGNITTHKHDDGTDLNRTKAGLNSIGASPTRNLRSVWTIPSAPFREAHFATFPPALAETCIKAGTSERGCCPTCGAPWVRVVKRTRMRDGSEVLKGAWASDTPQRIAKTGVGHWRDKTTTTETTGWEPGCSCHHASPVPCVVLDPFVGSGTSMLVADRLQRDGIGIELNPGYVEMATARLSEDIPLFSGVG